MSLARYETPYTTVTTPEEIEEALRSLKEADEKAKAAFNEAIRGKGLERWLILHKKIFPSDISVHFNLNRPIKISVLRRADESREEILIERQGLKAVLPRLKNNYDVSAHCDPICIGKIPAYLIVDVLLRPVPENPLLAGGICRVYMGNTGAVHFNLINLDAHLAKGEIASILKKVKERVDEALEKIFKECLSEE